MTVDEWLDEIEVFSTRRERFIAEVGGEKQHFKWLESAWEVGVEHKLETDEYRITDVNLWEKDALLCIGEWKVYFQFDHDDLPTLEDAIKFLVKEAEKQYEIRTDRR